MLVKAIAYIAVLTPLVAQADAVFIHPQTKIEVGDTIGELKFRKGEIYPGARGGSILAFSSQQAPNVQLTLYIYKEQGTVKEQGDDARASLELLEQRGTYKNMKVGPLQKVGEDVFQFRGSMTMKDDKTKLFTYGLITTMKGFTVKARITGEDLGKNGEDHIVATKTAVIKLVGKELEKK